MPNMLNMWQAAGMSALPPKADIFSGGLNVRYVLKSKASSLIAPWPEQEVEVLDRCRVIVDARAHPTPNTSQSSTLYPPLLHPSDNHQTESPVCGITRTAPPYDSNCLDVTGTEGSTLCAERGGNIHAFL
jgi:hypothetical protein